MKTEFNLLPLDYDSRPPSLWRRCLCRSAAFCVLIFCFAEFLAFAFIYSRQLMNRRFALLEEEKTTLNHAAESNRRYKDQSDRRKLWQFTLEEALCSVPAGELLSAAYELLPETGAIDSLSADDKKCVLSGLLAEPEKIGPYLKDLEARSEYGPFRLIERRLIRKGALSFRAEAPRRKP